MSTNGMTSWAVDLKDVGAIYPFQGTEVLLVLIGLTLVLSPGDPTGHRLTRSGDIFTG